MSLIYLQSWIVKYGFCVLPKHPYDKQAELGL